MNLEELLRDKELSARITLVWSWLYYDNDNETWVVRQKKPYDRKTKFIIETNDISKAIDALIQPERVP